ncbi:carbohydrate ABC transporter permease [Streptomyces sp. RKAG293]|uniref:carbohydrate ABC transporter permease n=1 Tax=Streptomyces sp. RKAG293 TaxID=2893403 RepID=UPI002033E43F|nr:carbohydrate ABC transporter permease [Streptomyces sp. RKAG293]MCM2417124.1 carbohydrate ABC transporter permease [Streptomyces sp. RKAG293]
MSAPAQAQTTTPARDPFRTDGAPPLRRPRRGRNSQLTAGRGIYAVLAVVVLLSLFPLYWTVVAASRDNASITRMPPVLLPGSRLWSNLGRVFSQSDMQLALLNSVIVSSLVTVSVIATSTLAGFAFAKLRFRGRNGLLGAVVATMMVPTQLGIIPLYIMMANWLHWTDHLQALIVPSIANAFGVFFMRQYLVTAVPDELLDAGRMDGCTTRGLCWHVVVPAARPAMAVLGMLTFMATWNDFYWPKVVMTQQNPTVQLSLSELASGYFRDNSLVLAGTLVSSLPIIVVFLLMGRQILDGIMQGAMKG